MKFSLKKVPVLLENGIAACISQAEGVVKGLAPSQLIKNQLLQALTAATALTTTAYIATRERAEAIEFKHEGESICVPELDLEEKITQLMHGSLYDSRFGYGIDTVLNPKSMRTGIAQEVTDWLTDAVKTDVNYGGMHLYRGDARSPAETKRTIREVMARSKIPPFISMDIVGGYTRHLGITQEELKGYGIPEDFLALAKKHGIELPAQEHLGKIYEKLTTPKEKHAFLMKMKDYGASIARLCDDLDVTVDFGPVLDTVVDTDGASFEAKNDESYSEKYITIEVLGFHFIKGFQEVFPHTILAPKHFVGTGKITPNPHEDSLPTSSISPTDGSILPFKDAITGTLFVDRFTRANEPWLFEERRCALGNKCKTDIDHFFEPEDFKASPVTGIMVGHAQSSLSKNSPGTISKEMITDRLQGSLAFKGITWTDDLGMGAITGTYGNSCDDVAEVYTRSLVAGATMPMTLHSGRCIDEVLERIQGAIALKQITEKEIDERVLAVLNAKAALGLVTKADKKGCYTNRAKEFLDAEQMPKSGPSKVTNGKLAAK